MASDKEYPVANKRRLDFQSIIAGLAIVAILVLGAVFRLTNLGALGLWIDEDLTWIASQGILQHGWPIMPSGETYDRAIPYSYLVALVTWLAGSGESALRLPSVLFSLGTILVIYRLGSRLGGRPVALTSAFVMAVSLWEVHYAQIARMYAPLAFLFNLSVYLIYRGYFDGSKRAFAGSLATAFFACALHPLGGALALIYLLPAVFPEGGRPPARWMIAGAVAVGLGIGVTSVIPSGTLRFMGREPGHAVLRLPFGPAIDLNRSALLLVDIARSHPWIAAAAGAGGIVVSVWFLRSLRRTASVGRLATFAGIGFVLALLANQLVLAAMMGVLVIKGAARSAREAGLVLARLGACAIAITLLILAARAFTEGMDLGERRFVRLFVSLPRPFYRLLFSQYPVMLLIVLAGAAYEFLRSLPHGSDHRRLFLAGSFLAPLFLMGLFESPYLGFRYNFYLNGLFVLCFSLMVVSAVRAALGRWRLQTRSRIARIVPTAAVLLALLVVGEQADPRKGWAASRRGYGYNFHLVRDPDLNASFHYDFKGCAEQVHKELTDSDIVIAMSATHIVCYRLPIHYRISALKGVYALSDSGPVDWYTGSRILTGPDQLRSLLDRNTERAVWLIYSDRDPKGPAVNLSEEMLVFLRGLDGHLPVARDGISHVIRLPAGRSRLAGPADPEAASADG